MPRAISPVRLGAWALGVVALMALVWALRAVLTPIFFAFLIAYMLDPVADRLERLKLPRAAAIVLILTVAIGLIAGVLLLLLPRVVGEVAGFFRELPGAARRLADQWGPVLEGYGIPVPHSFGEIFDQLRDDTDGVAQRAVGPATAVLGWIVGGTASAVGAVVNFFVIPVFAFYLLYDFDRMTAAITDLVPNRSRENFVALAKEVDEVLGQFVRGQLLVMFALAVCYSVGYSIVGVRLALPIGIAAGLVAFIPYVGGATALVLALGMCFFDWQGWDPVIGVVIVYAVVQVLEGFVITPAIVGDKVGLSAIWVLFALLAFGELFGFFGVLLAVPAAAVAKIFVVHAVDKYRGSDLYLAGVDGSADPPAEDGSGAARDAAPTAVEGASVPSEGEGGQQDDRLGESAGDAHDGNGDGHALDGDELEQDDQDEPADNDRAEDEHGRVDDAADDERDEPAPDDLRADVSDAPNGEDAVGDPPAGQAPDGGQVPEEGPSADEPNDR